MCCTASSRYKLKTKKKKQVCKEAKNEGRHWEKVIDLLRKKMILQLGSKLQVERRERERKNKVTRLKENVCFLVPSRVSVIDLGSLVLHHSHLFSALIS